VRGREGEKEIRREREREREKMLERMWKMFALPSRRFSLDLANFPSDH